MDALGQYVISVATAAILCGMVLKIIPKGINQELLKILCGLFLAFTLISPLRELQPEKLDLQAWLDSFSAEEFSKAGQEEARRDLEGIISQQTQAYILDKAKELGADIQVNVYLSGDPYPIPEAVIITGRISSEQKIRLECVLEDELGIPKEFHTWKESPR